MHFVKELFYRPDPNPKPESDPSPPKVSKIEEDIFRLILKNCSLVSKYGCLGIPKLKYWMNETQTFHNFVRDDTKLNSIELKFDVNYISNSKTKEKTWNFGVVFYTYHNNIRFTLLQKIDIGLAIAKNGNDSENSFIFSNPLSISISQWDVELLHQIVKYAQYTIGQLTKKSEPDTPRRQAPKADGINVVKYKIEKITLRLEMSSKEFHEKLCLGSSEIINFDFSRFALLQLISIDVMMLNELECEVKIENGEAYFEDSNEHKIHIFNKNNKLYNTGNSFGASGSLIYEPPLIFVSLINHNLTADLSNLKIQISDYVIKPIQSALKIIDMISRLEVLSSESKFSDYVKTSIDALNQNEEVIISKPLVPTKKFKVGLRDLAVNYINHNHIAKNIYDHPTIAKIHIDSTIEGTLDSNLAIKGKINHIWFSLGIVNLESHHKELKEDYIIYPTGIEFNYYQGKDIRADLNFTDELCVDVSSKHLKIVVDLQAKLLVPKKKADVVVVHAPQQASRSFSKNVYLNCKIPNIYVTMFIGQDQDLMSQKVHSFFNIHLSNLAGTLIYLPERSNSMDVSVSVNLRSYHFNERLSSFEPVVENFKIDANVQTSDIKNHLSINIEDLFLNFSTAALDSGLRIIEEFYYLASILNPVSNLNFAQKNAICEINNRCGLDLNCWVNIHSVTFIKNGESKVISSESQLDKLIRSFDDVSFKIVPKNLNKKGLYLGKGNESRQVIPYKEPETTLNMKFDLYEHILQADFQREGIFPYQIDINGGKVMLIVEIKYSFEREVKTITLKSNIELSNHFPKPLKVRLHFKQGKFQKKNELLLEPGKTIPVPLNQLSFEEIEILQVCSQEDVRYQWSKPKKVPNVAEFRAVMINTVEDSTNETYVMAYADVRRLINTDGLNRESNLINILPESLLLRQRDSCVITINFTQLIQIENLLPVPLSFKFKTHETKQFDKLDSSSLIFGHHNVKAFFKNNPSLNSKESRVYEVPELEVARIIDINPLKGITMSMNVQGYEWSDFHEIVDPSFSNDLKSYFITKEAKNSDINRSPEINEKRLDNKTSEHLFKKLFQFFDEKSGEQLNICLETLIDRGMMKLTLFAHHWFLNETSLPLSLKFKEDSFAYDPIHFNPSNAFVDGDEVFGEKDCLKFIPDVHERKILSDELDKAFFSLKSTQWSQNYVRSLLGAKKNFLKIVTTNFTDSSTTTFQMKIPNITDLSTDVDFANMPINEPYVEVSEKSLDGKGTSKIYEFCLNIIQLPGIYSRSKLVLISPKYIFVNSTDMDICISMTPSNKEIYTVLKKMESSSFYGQFGDKSKSIYVKINDQNYTWSSSMSLINTANFVFRCKNVKGDKVTILAINIVKHSSIMLVVIKRVDDKPPYILENNTRYHIKLTQKDKKKADSLAESTPNFDVINPKSQIAYAWDTISKTKDLDIHLIDTENNQQIFLGNIDFEKKERVVLSKKHFDQISIDFDLKTPTWYVKFNYEGSILESEVKIEKSLEFNLKIGRIGISILDHVYNSGFQRELLYIFYEKLSLDFRKDKTKVEFYFRLIDWQIDNKMVQSEFPVLMMTRKDQKEEKTLVNKIYKKMTFDKKEKIPKDHKIDYFFKFALVLETAKNSLNIVNIDKFKWSIRPIEFDIDGNMIDVLRRVGVNLFQKITPLLALKKTTEIIKEEVSQFSIEDLKEPMHESKSMNEEGIVVSSLKISKINILMNFTNLRGIVRDHDIYLLKILAAVFNNFGSITLNFDEFLFGNTKVAIGSLINQIISFYSNMINKQMYWMLANADIIGNPRMFLNQISSAFTEFFDTLKNQMSFNPILIGYGILNSSRSFVHNVLTAFVNSGDKILHNLQNGIFLTLADREDLEESSDSASQSSEQKKAYETFIKQQKTDSLDSILGSFSNLLHTLILFPFTQPVMPYVMKKRKKYRKKQESREFFPKRPLRYIGGSGILESYSEAKSYLQEYLLNEHGEFLPVNLGNFFENDHYGILFQTEFVMIFNKKDSSLVLVPYLKARFEKLNNLQCMLTIYGKFGKVLRLGQEDSESKVEIRFEVESKEEFEKLEEFLKSK